MQLHCFSLAFGGLGESAGDEMAEPADGEVRRLRVVSRAQSGGERDAVQAVLRHSSIAVYGPQNHMREGEARVQVDRLGQFRNCKVEVPGHHMHVACREMRPGIVRVRLNGALRDGARFGQARLHFGPSLMNAGGKGPGEEAVGAGIVRFDLERSRQQALGGLDFPRRAPGPNVGHRLHHEAPGVEAFRPPALEPLLFGRKQRRLDRRGDAPAIWS